MSKKLNYQLAVETLLARDINLIATLEFERLFGSSKIAAQKFLSKYATKGTFTRLKNGLYIFSLNPPGEMLIANKLYEPSYLSFEYALSFYGLMPESVYTITSATTKPTREFNVNGKLFSYSRLKQDVYGGYLPRQLNGRTVFMAEMEKALADYLYFVDLKKKALSDRLKIKLVNRNKFNDWIGKFNRPSLTNLAKSLYA